MNKYTWHIDPGHAWLEAPVDEVRRFERTEQVQLSDYSYRRLDSVYLEEDCDATAFLNWIGRDNFTLQDCPEDGGWIRNLNRYESYWNHCFMDAVMTQPIPVMKWLQNYYRNQKVTFTTEPCHGE
jgi:hypothetical protein